MVSLSPANDGEQGIIRVWWAVTDSFWLMMMMTKQMMIMLTMR